MRTAKTTRRLPIAASAGGIFMWAGIGLIGGKLDDYESYDFMTIPPVYVIGFAFALAALQLFSMVLAHRPTVRWVAIVAMCFWGVLAWGIFRSDWHAPSWGLCLIFMGLNMALTNAPGVWQDDRFTFRKL